MAVERALGATPRLRAGSSSIHFETVAIRSHTKARALSPA
jgi:hypothetical protein